MVWVRALFTTVWHFLLRKLEKTHDFGTFTVGFTWPHCWVYMASLFGYWASLIGTGPHCLKRWPHCLKGGLIDKMVKTDVFTGGLDKGVFISNISGVLGVLLNYTVLGVLRVLSLIYTPHCPPA